MKKKLLSVFSAAVAIVLAFSTLVFSAGCKKEEEKLNFLQENIVDDNYDNYYEIFVQSYCDSNGDGYGDLNGVTSKLDYIRDMGYTGIWLMPIHPSASYHGYDVKDYTAINPVYGTMEDYENLISAAHEKGVKVIIDLVVNHTSSQHPWFTASRSYRQGNHSPENAKYADFYTWSNSQKSGYNQTGNLWYESWFSGSMPDLNLDSEGVRAEIENIVKFWLEKGTDGFRLDGCLYYYYGNTEKGRDFCAWLNETAEKYNPNVYIVGETWSGRSNISLFYQSGVDSFFYFDTAGSIQATINISDENELWTLMRNCASTSANGIAAPFLSNHDNGIGRIAGRMAKDEEKVKFAYGLLSMFSGNTFTYYGDEIGMSAKNPNSDPDLRVGMYWSESTPLTKLPSGGSAPEYKFGSVEQQQGKSSSILNYYKLCNNARNAFPALMRGENKLLDTGGMGILGVEKTYGDEKVTVIINLNSSEKEVTAEGTLAQSICVTGKITKSGNTLKMPKYSIAILT